MNVCPGWSREQHNTPCVLIAIPVYDETGQELELTLCPDCAEDFARTYLPLSPEQVALIFEVTELSREEFNSRKREIILQPILEPERVEAAKQLAVELETENNKNKQKPWWIIAWDWVRGVRNDK